MSFFKRLFGKTGTPVANEAPIPFGAVPETDRAWDDVYEARGRAYEAGFGKLPQDIQKLGNLTGVWPGGGLYIIPAPQVREGAAIYASFGLTNPDMPTTITIDELTAQAGQDDQGRAFATQGTLVRKEKMPPVRDWPGYGYEIMIAAADNQEWPLWLLQWAVQAEILHDIGMRDRVEQYGGMTVESVSIAPDASVHLLITKAQAPLMPGLVLPNGRADMIVITVITAEEMLWSKEHGREALLLQLQEAGVGQFSVLGRASVVALPDIGVHRVLVLPENDKVAHDYDAVGSREHAQLLVAHGRLEKILSFPDRFGGEDVALNQLYVPVGGAALKDQVTEELAQAIERGLIDQLDVRAEYKGTSFVPANIHVVGTHSQHDGRFERTIALW